MDSRDTVAADVVAANAANMCHAELLEGDEDVCRSCQPLSRGVRLCSCGGVDGACDCCNA